MNARIAGITYLLYIAVAFPSLTLLNGAARGEGMAAKLAGMSASAGDMRIAILLSLMSCFAALVLAVTLYGVTRDEDREIALLAMSCRLAEGIIGGVFIITIMGLLWLATATGASGLDAATSQALAALLLKFQDWGPLVSASFFAVGSMLFCWLLLRGRMIPVPLAWLGLAASVVLVIGVPAQLAFGAGGLIVQIMWLPMAVFEIVAAVWLIVKGVREPAR